MFHPTRPVTIAVIVGTLLLSACGGGSDAAISDASSSDATAVSADASFNDADVLFAQGMVPHHAQAVEMAALALAPEAGASAAITALATEIQGAQEPEIATMTEWLQIWGRPLEMPGMEGMDDMAGMNGMDGMMTADQMTSLATLTGPDFDRAWAEMMIAHHQGAIAQAEALRAGGANPEVRALADQIITAQQAEITQMQAMLNG